MVLKMVNKSAKDFLRIVDVNYNRAREGMRVCEEVARFALSDAALTSNGKVVAILHVSDIYKPDKTHEAKQVLKTDDATHPGVKRLQSVGDTYVGGRISVVNLPPPTKFAEYPSTPTQTRKLFEERGWKRIVAVAHG